MKFNRKRLACRTIDKWHCGATTWRVDSDCGVVKLFANEHCLTALNPAEARTLGRNLFTALGEAATSVDRARTGGER